MRYRAMADYYDAEYEHTEMLRRDVPFFLEHLPKRRQRVLELAAGTGRCAIPIAQAGHRVVGVDNDARMLAIAEGKRQTAGMDERRLRFVHGDLLGLDAMELGTGFDWACIFFNTFLVFTTVEQQDTVLRGARDRLKPGGRLWIDIFQPDLALLSRPESSELDPHLFYVPHLDRTVCRTTHIAPRPAHQRQRVTFEYRWFDGRGREHIERRNFDLTYLFARELRLLAERNGLRVEEMYGNYDGSVLRDDSPRIIAVCRRVGEKDER